MKCTKKESKTKRMKDVLKPIKVTVPPNSVNFDEEYIQANVLEGESIGR